MPDSPVIAAQELLSDSFTRQLEHVESLTSGLTQELASVRITPEANTVAWLIWHSARVQDDHVCDIIGTEQQWTAGGWAERFDLDLPREDTGYGHSAEDVAKVQASPELLEGYFRAVHEVTLRYVTGVSDDELTRIVDERWSPPVTASARLVSVIDDCAQHLGQAAFILGVAR